jgi:hypothetical protein
VFSNAAAFKIAVIVLAKKITLLFRSAAAESVFSRKTPFRETGGRFLKPGWFWKSLKDKGIFICPLPGTRPALYLKLPPKNSNSISTVRKTKRTVLLSSHFPRGLKKTVPRVRPPAGRLNRARGAGKREEFDAELPRVNAAGTVRLLHRPAPG